MSNGPFVRSAGAFVIYFLREKVCSTPESGHSGGQVSKRLAKMTGWSFVPKDTTG